MSRVLGSAPSSAASVRTCLLSGLLHSALWSLSSLPLMISSVDTSMCCRRGFFVRVKVKVFACRRRGLQPTRLLACRETDLDARRSTGMTGCLTLSRGSGDRGICDAPVDDGKCWCCGRAIESAACRRAGLLEALLEVLCCRRCSPLPRSRPRATNLKRASAVDDGRFQVASRRLYNNNNNN